MKTDLESRLCNTLSMVSCMRNSMNTITIQTLSVGIATETVTLTWKLRAMLNRWEVYLPFHECIDVDFRQWHTKFVKWFDGVKGNLQELDKVPEPLFQPNAPFRLDLTDMMTKAIKPLGDDLKADVQRYVTCVDEMVEYVRNMDEESDAKCRAHLDYQALDLFHRDYVGYLSEKLKHDPNVTKMELEMKIKPWLDTCFRLIGDQPFMMYSLDMALGKLIDILKQIDDFFNSDFSNEQLLRLSNRLYCRHCPQAKDKAFQTVQRWKNNWPSKRLKERAQQERADIIAKIQQNFTTLRLDEYIDIERPNPLNDAEFGRFLFVSRTQLTNEDVASLFHQLFCIQALNRLIDPMGTEADLSAALLDEERKKIYYRLTELVRKADWKSGMTAERVQHCFAQLLLSQSTEFDKSVNAPKYTAIFWNLLLNRRGCDTDFRSLKLTWLNLVGYFRSRGLLEGGSLNLCRFFFPNDTPEGQYNDRDYNAIVKGAGDRAGNDFHDLAKALDLILGLEPPK